MTTTRSMTAKAAVLGGGLLFALFVLVVWGALHDAASAEATTAGLPAGVAPGSIQKQAPTVPGVAPTTKAQSSTPVKVGAPAAAAAPVMKAHVIGAGRAIAAARTIASARPQAGVAKPHPTIAAVTSRTVVKAPAISIPSSARPQAVPPAAASHRTATKGARGVTGAATTPPSVNQCNGSDNVGGAAVACEVTVTNNLNLVTGATSSTVTTNDCHGAAGATPTCITTTTTSSQLITSITQCDGSGNGGGATVTCAVHIVNNITGTTTVAPVTINQCNSSGAGGVSPSGPTTLCFPTGSTSSADITQCDGSGNGGGSPFRVVCTVTPSSQSSALPVTVDQCNGSGNGGGALVGCTVSVTNNLISVLPPARPGGPAPPTVGVPPSVIGPGPPRLVVAGFGPATPFESTSSASPSVTGDDVSGSSTGGQGLAATGSSAARMALWALLAMLLGSLLLVFSKLSAGRTSR